MERVIVTRAHLKITLGSSDRAAGEESGADDVKQPDPIMAPFVVRSPPRKGYVHQPQSKAEMTAETRDALLRAIARARRWLDDILSGAPTSFDEIATREGLVERHVRFLMPLAFVAPSIIEAIADGAAPADLTVTRLARSLPNSWAHQVHAILRR